MIVSITLHERPPCPDRLLSLANELFYFTQLAQYLLVLFNPVKSWPVFEVAAKKVPPDN